MNKDAISRSAIIQELQKMVDLETVGNVASDIGFGIAMSVTRINYAPALDVAPVVHGHWVHCKGKSNLWYCSECGDKMLYNPTRRTYNVVKLPMAEKNKFCRNCGARMDGEADAV